MQNVKRILVVTKGNEYFKDAVQGGIDLARMLHSELQVLHLVSNPVDQEALNAPLPFRDDRHTTYSSVEQQAREELDQILRREVGVPVKMTVRSGKATDEIVKIVKDEKIDLAVMLAHEEGKIEHMLFGRDAVDIIRKLPCSILLVKREPESIKW